MFLDDDVFYAVLWLPVPPTTRIKLHLLLQSPSRRVCETLYAAAFTQSIIIGVPLNRPIAAEDGRAGFIEGTQRCWLRREQTKDSCAVLAAICAGFIEGTQSDVCALSDAGADRGSIHRRGARLQRRVS